MLRTSIIPIVRGLLKQPGFVLLSVLTLALGIGVNIAIFSALQALVLNPLPYPDSQRLAAVYEDATWIGYAKNTPAPANYFDWKRQSKSFEDIGATSGCRAVFTGDAAPEEVRCRNFTANLWSIIGVAPLAGRWFNEGEDHPNPDVAVISEDLWVRRYGRETSILNRTVQINGRGVRVVGVMPQWFRFGGEQDIEVWMPVGFTSEQRARRGSHYLSCYGRLKRGVSLQQASAELRGIQQRLDKLYPNETDPRMGARVESLQSEMVGTMGPTLWVLMAAAAIVLIIACSNVANLLLARATGKHHEMAVRTALGASARQLVAHVFADVLLLTVAGSIVGMLLAYWSRRLLENFIPPALKNTVGIHFDWRVIAFAAAAGLVAAGIAALAPMIHLRSVQLMSVLRQDSRTGSGRSAIRLRGILVVAEVALTVALLSGAGLMVRSLLAIWNTNLGFNPANLLTVRVSLPPSRYNTNQKQYAFYDRTLSGIRAISGIVSADFASTPPFYSIGNSMGFALEGRTPAGRWEPGDMLTRVATPGYLHTIGASLRAGRLFSERDRDGAEEVAIVNETFARALYPNQNVIGKRIRFSGKAPVWRRIVGVVADVKERGYDLDSKPVTYVTVRQMEDWTAGQLVVRTNIRPDLVLGAIRQAIQNVDPNQPIGVWRTFDQVLAMDQASRRQQMFLLVVFAGLSLVMACLGIYTVLAYTVELRRQEIGIRMALGAGNRSVVQLVTAQGMRLVGMGLLLGLAVALFGSRLLQASLYGVRPFDPLTFFSVCAILASVGLLACLVPSRRAAATSPSIALRG